jgi:transcriptional regulator with XRE-family HTH domain
MQQLAKPFQRRLRKNLLRLVALRKMTLERLAVEADLTSSFVSQVLAGRSSISLAALERLATVLEVDITELLKP